MSSPESTLRRRGRGSVSENSASHSRAESDGFGSFVDSTSAFPSSFDAGLSEPVGNHASSPSVAIGSPTRTRSVSSSQRLHGATAVEGDDDDEWAEADLVSSFSPVETHFAVHVDQTPTTSATASVPVASSKPAPRHKISGRGASSDWADWNTFLASHTLPTQQPHSSAEPSASKMSTATNPADEAFFDAFEVASKANRIPSPPIIDLRDVEKKLEAKKQQQLNPKHIIPADDDFFSRFERAPEAALGRKSPLVLEPDQLESMHDARTSPLPASSAATQKTDSYFGSSTQPKPIEGKGPHTGGASREHRQESGPSSGSPASPSSWTGSLRRTWTTLRGIQHEVASHLPSVSDFIVPPEETEEGTSAAARAVDTNPGGGFLFATDAPADHPPGGHAPHAARRRNSGALPHASDNSQGTPFSSHPAATSSGFSSGAAAPSHSTSGSPLRARDLFASSSGSNLAAGHGASTSVTSSGTLRRGPVHASTAPISGAPGFDTFSTRKWNTGQWTLDDEKQKRSIPVTLSNRRDETETVIEPVHAAQLQALLPPRLQLGRRWSLLYSLDQHGISLQTLYHRVANGLDPTKANRTVSGQQGGEASNESAEAEGWLRGASRETQEAMGTRAQNGGSKMHVGGGLSSISDAGLVIAIKDADDNVFGAFVNEKLRPQQHYYGTGECFLWRTTVGNAEGKAEAEARVEKYRWTGKNDYMILSESTFLSVGGGEGKFGLWVDGALEKGVSSNCPAFDNEVLCDRRQRGSGERDKEARFECYGLEVWAVGID